jgi:hypothetical protein
MGAGELISSDEQPRNRTVLLKASAAASSRRLRFAFAFGCRIGLGFMMHLQKTDP